MDEMNAQTETVSAVSRELDLADGRVIQAEQELRFTSLIRDKYKTAIHNAFGSVNRDTDAIVTEDAVFVWDRRDGVKRYRRVDGDQIKAVVRD